MHVWPTNTCFIKLVPAWFCFHYYVLHTFNHIYVQACIIKNLWIFIMALNDVFIVMTSQICSLQIFVFEHCTNPTAHKRTKLPTTAEWYASMCRWSNRLLKTQNHILQPVFSTQMKRGLFEVDHLVSNLVSDLQFALL